jgi:hypothetical protein
MAMAVGLQIIRHKGKGAMLLLALLCSGTLGHLSYTLLGAAMQTPVPLGENWRTISQAEDLSDGSIAEGGSHILDGALTISEHADYQSDLVILAQEQPYHRIELKLADDSDAMALVLGPSRPKYKTHMPISTVIYLRPGGIKLNSPGSQWESVGSRIFRFEVREGWLCFVDGEKSSRVESYTPNVIEIMTAGAQTRLLSIRLWGEEGEELLFEDYKSLGGRKASWRAVLAGMAVGLCTLLLARVGPLGLVLSLAGLALPLYTLSVGRKEWLFLTEQLNLHSTAPWELATIVVGLSLLPLAVGGVGALFRSSITRSLDGAGTKGMRIQLFWMACAALALAIGSADPETEHTWGPGLAVFLAFPLILASTKGRIGPRWLLWDLPALGSLATFGWTSGLLGCTLWRGAVAANSHSGKGGLPLSAYSLALLLSLPFGAEGIVRSTYLDQAWSFSGLELDKYDEAVPPLGEAGWIGSCPTQGEPRRIAVAGGHSVGGGYPYSHGEHAYFTTKVHAALCRQFRDLGLQTFNYGAKGQDSHSISKGIESLMEEARPELLILYLGYGDLIDTNHLQSKRQRDLEPGAAMPLWPLRRSRLLATMKKVQKRKEREGMELVPEVPLEDAVRNIKAVVDATQGKSELLLLNELSLANHYVRIQEYGAMQKEIAEQNAHVHSLDLHEMVLQTEVDSLILEGSILSEEGNKRVAKSILPKIAELLGLSVAPGKTAQ